MTLGWFKLAKVTTLSLPKQVDIIADKAIELCREYVGSRVGLGFPIATGIQNFINFIQVLSPQNKKIGVDVYIRMSDITAKGDFLYKVNGECLIDTEYKRKGMDIELYVGFHKIVKPDNFAAIEDRIKDALEYTILHEAAHAGRIADLSDEQRKDFIKRLIYPRERTELEYRRQPHESDADISSILSLYNRLTEEQKSQIQTYDELFETVAPNISLWPSVGNNLWGESEKWKRYLITRLMREGLILQR